MCVAPEVSSISSGAGSAGHAPEVVASSVMAEHGKAPHHSGAPRLRPAAAAGLAVALAAFARPLPPRHAAAAALLAAALAVAAVGVT